jgi:hypothetical protein
MAGYYKRGNKPSASIKAGRFLDHTSYYQLLQKGSMYVVTHSTAVTPEHETKIHICFIRRLRELPCVPLLTRGTQLGRSGLRAQGPGPRAKRAVGSRHRAVPDWTKRSAALAITLSFLHSLLIHSSISLSHLHFLLHFPPFLLTPFFLMPVCSSCLLRFQNLIRHK